MKKTLLFLAAAVFALTACNKQTYVDGTYMVTYDEIDSHGWNAFVEFTLTEDEISNVNFDYKDADGNLKSMNAGYNTAMFDAVGTNPETYCPELEAQIEATTIDPWTPIDGVTGATGSSENANTLMEAGLEAAMDGDTDVVIPQIHGEE